eukprot:scaffold43212_cov71-Phaeocystis_antarctica.AAC.4
MHCGLLASHASTLSTGAFDAPGSASKLSRLLPTCPRVNARSNPRGMHWAARWASAPYGFTEGAGRPARLTAGLRPACEHGARLVAGGRIVRHGRAPHLAARLASEAAGEAAVRDVAQSGACAGRDCGTGLHDVGEPPRGSKSLARSNKDVVVLRGRGSQGTDSQLAIKQSTLHAYRCIHSRTASNNL